MVVCKHSALRSFNNERENHLYYLTMVCAVMERRLSGRETHDLSLVVSNELHRIRP